MFAYIPARIGSRRIPKKNIKPLAGVPVIERVIRTLAKLDQIQGIAISTDSEEVVDLVKKLPKVATLGLRDSKLSGDLAGFQDLIREDLPRYQKHFGDDSVLFATATGALVPPAMFAEGVEKFKTSGSQGLVISVTPYEVSAALALSEEADGVKVWFPEQYLLPTKDLPKTYYDSGCFYILNLKQFQANQPLQTLFDLKPVQLVPLSPEMGIDVDTPEDWERMEQAYRRLQESGK